MHILQKSSKHEHIFKPIHSYPDFCMPHLEIFVQISDVFHLIPKRLNLFNVPTLKVTNTVKPASNGQLNFQRKLAVKYRWPYKEG